MPRTITIDVDTDQLTTTGYIGPADYIKAGLGYIVGGLAIIGKHLSWELAEQHGGDICAAIGKHLDEAKRSHQ